MPDDSVQDDEGLYRRVLNNPQNFPSAKDGSGTIHLSSQIFSERTMRPSVDRAHLREHDPTKTQNDPSDGILLLFAHQVRSARTDRYKDGKLVEKDGYQADVEPVPLPGNPSHAEIYGRPGFDTKSAFHKMIERLARLPMEWVIPPADLRKP